MENRNIFLHFRVTPEEKEQIQRKMSEVGVHNMSAYLRKMALDGYCIHMDFDFSKQIVSLLLLLVGILI